MPIPEHDLTPHIGFSRGEGVRDIDSLFPHLLYGPHAEALQDGETTCCCHYAERTNTVVAVS